jgi:quercetin dioxygenase-like cupin family protein
MTTRLARAAAHVLATLACFVTVAPSHALDPGQPAVVVTPLTSTGETAAGQPIVLPQKDVRVVVSRFEIAPGAKLPVHSHPYQRYAYVLAGTLEVTDAVSAASKTYKAGDFIVEMVDRWHWGANVGADPVVLIVIDQVEGDAQQTILKP